MVAGHNYNDVSYLVSNHNSVITKVCNSVGKAYCQSSKIMRVTKLIILARTEVRVPGFVYYACQWVDSEQALLGWESLLCSLDNDSFQCRGHDRIQLITLISEGLY